MEKFFNNPGLAIIGETISMVLDHNSLMSLKKEFDPHFLNESRFWLKKCDFLDQSWNDLSQEIKTYDENFGTNLESNFVAILIKIHQDPKMYAQSTPLHLASEIGDVQLVNWYLLDDAFTNYGYKLDFCVDQRGNTPIFVAAAEGHEEIVKLLIPFYENPRVKGMFTWSALTIASIQGHLGIVKLLSSSNDFKSDDDIQDLKNSRCHAQIHKRNSVVHFCDMILEERWNFKF